MNERDFMIFSKRYIFGYTYEQLSNEFDLSVLRIKCLLCDTNKDKFIKLLKGALNEQ